MRQDRMTMRRTVLIASAVLGVAVSGGRLPAQLPAPEEKPIIGAYAPVLSPDGKRLAFCYRGDIWVVDSTGGRATPLTRNVEMDAYPEFSPDGNWISFSSTRNGSWDIYLIPAAGGSVRRLTWYSGSEIAHGWSPDGKSLIFCGWRDTADAALFTIDAKTLRLRKLAQDLDPMNDANFSPDGNLVVYSRYGFDWTRPRYTGSAAAQIWVLDLKSGARRAISPNDRQHLWPRFLPDGKSIVTVTTGEATPSSPRLNEHPPKIKDSPARTPNLWVFDLTGKGRQITTFAGGSVRDPNVAARTGDIVFAYEHDLWLLRAGQKEPTKLTIYASQDETQSYVRREVLKSGVTEADPSPDAKYFAFGIRGDIWTILTDKPKGAAGKSAEVAHRLTDWAGDDSGFLWSSDGKKLYFRSDRDFNTRAYEMDVESLKVKPLWEHPEEVGELHLSPDGKKLAFWTGGPERGLFVITLETGEVRRLVSVPEMHPDYQGGGDISWSPDMRWVAYTVGESNGAWNIWIIPDAGGTPVNVTRLNSSHSQPMWSPDGKYLFFQSNRDGDGLYVLPLTKEPARTSEFDIKFEKPKEFARVDIDFDDITRRIRKLSSQSPQADLTVTSEGKIMFVSEGDVWTVTYDGKETKRVTSGGGFSDLRVSKDAKKAYVVHNGDLTTITLDDQSKQEKVEFTADWDRDVRIERQAAFTQFWRSYSQGFYDPNMHGRDWEAIRKRYEPLLDAVETRDEFATLLQMMVGELECSHSEVGAAPGGNPSVASPHLGFMFDYSYEGPGIRVDKVPKGAPGSFPQTSIKPGEYVLAIDGKDVTLDENLYKTINGKEGRELEFLVNSKPSREGARTVKYVSMTRGEWDDLAYRNRIERLRNYVEAKSGGKIGYVHIAAMGDGDQARFEREFYEYALNKKAMIIDVRFNGGGYISDTLVDWLERKPHAYYQVRNAEPALAPPGAWDKPLVVLIDEHAFSDGEAFPAAIHTRGLAKLVGMPTPGYVIAVGEISLVDGTSARVPGMGVYRKDGSNEENNGEKPDYQVPLTVEDWLAERDPQVDKAIEVLSK